MTSVLVTGATGLIGANVCRRLRERGDNVRALVRPGLDTAALEELGVLIAPGDVTDRSSVEVAAKGCDVVVNSAATLDGAGQDPERQLEVNHRGSLHCYDVALDGRRRVVEVFTAPFLGPDLEAAERPPVSAETEVTSDPSTISERRASVAGLARVDAGEDVVFVVPGGGTFGPSPVVRHAFDPASLNALVLAAIRGQVVEFAGVPLPWVYARDVADVVIATIERGRAGATYVAAAPDDPLTTARFLSIACEEAGVEHRVADVDVGVDVDPADPGARKRFGPTIFDLATGAVPTPRFDDTETVQTLGGERISVRDGLINTVAWMRIRGLIP